MFLWDEEKKTTVLDMAITEKFSAYDMEKHVGVSRYHIKNLISAEQDYITKERERAHIPQSVEAIITDFHEKGQAQDSIAKQLDLTPGEVRRVILMWEKALADLEDEDAAINNVGADIAHLAKLKKEHPARQYEDDPRAAISGVGLPMRARSVEAYLP